MPQTLAREQAQQPPAPPQEQPRADTFALPAALPTHRKRWTQEQCDYLERSGLLPARYELIDGEVVERVGQNKPHAFSVTRAMAWLLGVFGADLVVTQATMEVRGPDEQFNRPEPDVFVLSESPTLDARPHEAADVRLIVEVCDTTQHDDLRLKPGLYARAGVAEYWVLDLPTRRLIAHAGPQDGAYTQILAYSEDESLSPASAPNASIRVGDLLPPPAAAAEDTAA